MADTKIEELKNKIRGALGDPKAPWYGSDLVSWVGDYIEEVEWLQDKLKAKSERIQELKAENAKLNIILYHRENGLSHPDFKAEIEISKQSEQIKGIENLLGEIEAVSCGEKQIECDGVYDDSDGLAWIYKRIQALTPRT